MRNTYIVKRTNVLSHAGIKDMKWGIRRFQNKDGTLTEAGKLRYRSGGDFAQSVDSRGRRTENMTEEGKKNYSSRASVASNVSKGLESAAKLTDIGKQKSKTTRPNYDNVTDEELKKRVARLSLEEQYGRLSGDAKKVRTGSDWVHEILQTGSILASMAGTAVSIYIALKALRGGKVV